VITSLAACGTAASATKPSAPTPAATPPGSTTTVPSTTTRPVATPQATTTTGRPAATTTTSTVPATTTTAPPPAGTPPPVTASADGGSGSFGPTDSGVLGGKIVAIDPGHNGGNASDPSYINAQVFNGVEDEACDTSGAETDAGYTEAEFNFNVAEYLTADLRAAGATVVLTRTTNTGVGPCVTQRADVGNQAHADAAISIHADGGPADGRGFAILEPVADGINSAIVAPSQTLGSDLRAAFAAGTGEMYSTYDGVDGIQPRNDLGGINLSTVPKVFIECANMRNAQDAALVTSPAWQELAASSIAAGITSFLTSS
jgi:N-acetylmuramoyl-L-alanine amidase